MRITRNRTGAIVAAMIVALCASLLPAGSALADHEPETLEVSPETQSQQSGNQVSLSASVGNPLSLLEPNIDFEIETGPGDTDGNTPKTPDMTCSILIGLLGCSVSYTAPKRGTDTIRAWIDFDASDTTNEYDNDEFPNEAPAGAGHPEPDSTDVVQVLWNQGPAQKLDCDDSNFNDVETNFTTGPGSNEIYTCKVSDAGNIGMEGFAIDAENLSTTQVNDPEDPNVDYKNFCVTGGDGTCQGQIRSLGRNGTADICFWVDTDADDTYDPNGGVEDGGDCDGETVAEAENNDVTDVTQITWVNENVPPVSRIDRPAQNGVYLDTAMTRFEGQADDAHSAINRVEVALRKYLANGKCKNWNGSTFVFADCKARHWVLATIVETNPDNGTVTWHYQFPPGSKLQRSDEKNGAAAKDYVVLARAIDAAGNVERTFRDTTCRVTTGDPNGCNRILFEIRQA